jgi:alpha-beta hydrolase superfamily lysophospholipase
MHDQYGREQHEHGFSTHDGVRLFYRHWPAHGDANGDARGALVLIHRGHEHSGRMAHLADEFDLPDFDVFAYDMRGHGRSPGARGDSPSFGTSVRDLQTFVEHLAATHGIDPANMVVVAQSVGAVVASTWAHDYAPKIRGLVLASPAFKVKLYVPFARPGLALMRRLRGNFFVNSYVKAKFLTHDPERIASYEADPLISRPISVDILLGLYEAAERVVADAAAIALPTQLLVSGSDWVVHHAPQHRFFERLSHPRKEKHVLPWASATVGWRSIMRVASSSTCSTGRRKRCRCAMRTAAGSLRTSRAPWPRRCRGTRRAARTGR